LERSFSICPLSLQLIDAIKNGSTAETMNVLQLIQALDLQVDAAFQTRDMLSPTTSTAYEIDPADDDPCIVPLNRQASETSTSSIMWDSSSVLNTPESIEEMLTPLHFAARENQPNIVYALLCAGLTSNCDEAHFNCNCFYFLER
jgi:hypothetical protein